jgi:uncharacterized caspase-like protein
VPGSAFGTLRVLTEERGKARAEDRPTVANIRRALEGLLRGRSRDEMVLLMLAGSGLELEVPSPRKGEPTRSFPFFVPADGDLRGVEYETGRSPTLLNLNYLMSDLGRCGAGAKLVMIDACRTTRDARGKQRAVRPSDVSIPHGVAALFSCAPGEASYESRVLGRGHGVFSYAAIQGLKGKAKNEDGDVSWDSLTGYVRTAVPREARKMSSVFAQNPHLVASLTGASPVLIKGRGEGR